MTKTDNGSVTVARQGAIATVTLENPGRLNAISVGMWRALKQTLDTLSADTTLRCIVVRGAGGNFAAGADIGEFPHVRGNGPAVRAYHVDVIAPALHAISHCLHPTVAAIDGVCVGGGLEIACHCDLRIAAAASRFGVPINRLGFPMAPGEMAGLLTLAGRAVTLEILLEGRIFDADEAMRKGLLTRVVPGTHFDEAVSAAVQRIARGAPLAARINKRMVHRLSPVPAPLTDAELAGSFDYCDTNDHAEGVNAFLDKRQPHFRGS